MNETATNSHAPLETRRRYRRWMDRSIGAGILGLFVAFGAWIVVPADPLVFAGVAIYWLGFLGYLGIWKGTSVTLFDEREEQMELKASGLTLSVFAFVLVFSAPAVVALSITDVYTVPPELWGAITAYVAVFVVFGIVYTYVKRSYT